MPLPLLLILRKNLFVVMQSSTTGSISIFRFPNVCHRGIFRDMALVSQWTTMGWDKKSRRIRRVCEHNCILTTVRVTYSCNHLVPLKHQRITWNEQTRKGGGVWIERQALSLRKHRTEETNVNEQVRNNWLGRDQEYGWREQVPQVPINEIAMW